MHHAKLSVTWIFIKNISFYWNNQSKKPNIIVGVIKRHLKWMWRDWTRTWTIFLKKSIENKKKVFLVDFNTDMMHCNEYTPKNQFLVLLASNSYLSYIIQPSEHTSHSRTLIDNICINLISKDIIFGNITGTISEHPPQFLISPNKFADSRSNKSNVFERSCSNFDQESFLLDSLAQYFEPWWENVKLAPNNFLDAMNFVLNKYDRLNKYKLRLKTNRWMTIEIQKSIIPKTNY